MCWFEGGVSRSGGVPEPVPGLALLPGSLTVHCDSEPERLAAYLRGIADGELPPGYAADDSAGLLFAGTELLACVASKGGAGIRRVAVVSRAAVPTPLPVKLLDSPPGLAASALASRFHDRLALTELRALRLGRPTRG
jgi:dipeptidase E